MRQRIRGESARARASSVEEVQRWRRMRTVGSPLAGGQRSGRSSGPSPGGGTETWLMHSDGDDTASTASSITNSSSASAASEEAKEAADWLARSSTGAASAFLDAAELHRRRERRRAAARAAPLSPRAPYHLSHVIYTDVRARHTAPAYLNPRLTTPTPTRATVVPAVGLSTVVVYRRLHRRILRAARQRAWLGLAAGEPAPEADDRATGAGGEVGGGSGVDSVSQDKKGQCVSLSGSAGLSTTAASRRPARRPQSAIQASRVASARSTREEAAAAGVGRRVPNLLEELDPAVAAAARRREARLRAAPELAEAARFDVDPTAPVRLLRRVHSVQNAFLPTQEEVFLKGSALWCENRASRA